MLRLLLADECCQVPYVVELPPLPAIAHPCGAHHCLRRSADPSEDYVHNPSLPRTADPDCPTPTARAPATTPPNSLGSLHPCVLHEIAAVRGERQEGWEVLVQGHRAKDLGRIGESAAGRSVDQGGSKLTLDQGGGDQGALRGYHALVHPLP